MEAGDRTARADAITIHIRTSPRRPFQRDRCRAARRAVRRRTMTWRAMARTALIRPSMVGPARPRHRRRPARGRRPGRSVARPRPRNAAVRVRPAAVRRERPAPDRRLRPRRHPEPRPIRLESEPGPRGAEHLARTGRRRCLFAGRGPPSARVRLGAGDISYTGTNVSERDLDVLLAHPIHLNLDAVSQIERVGRRVAAGGTSARARSGSESIRVPAPATRTSSHTAAPADEVRRLRRPGRRGGRRRGTPRPRDRHDPRPRRIGLARRRARWVRGGVARVAGIARRLRAAGHPIVRGQRRRRPRRAGPGGRAAGRSRRLCRGDRGWHSATCRRRDVGGASPATSSPRTPPCCSARS